MHLLTLTSSDSDRDRCVIQAFLSAVTTESISQVLRDCAIGLARDNNGCEDLFVHPNPKNDPERAIAILKWHQDDLLDIATQLRIRTGLFKNLRRIAIATHYQRFCISIQDPYPYSDTMLIEMNRTPLESLIEQVRRSDTGSALLWMDDLTPYQGIACSLKSVDFSGIQGILPGEEKDEALRRIETEWKKIIHQDYFLEGEFERYQAELLNNHLTGLQDFTYQAEIFHRNIGKLEPYTFRVNARVFRVYDEGTRRDRLVRLTNAVEKIPLVR